MRFKLTLKLEAEEVKPAFSIHKAIRSQMANGKLEGVEMHDRALAS
jgi:hypothetical protein